MFKFIFKIFLIFDIFYFLANIVLKYFQIILKFWSERWRDGGMEGWEGGERRGQGNRGEGRRAEAARQAKLSPV